MANTNDPHYRIKLLISGPESGGKMRDSKGNLIKNGKGSSAIGKYQFVDATWNALSRQYKQQYGRPLNKNHDYDHEIAMNMLIDGNAKMLKARGLPVNDLTLYAMHFQGTTSWIKDALEGKNTKVGEFFSSDAIKQNPTYMKYGKNSTASTVLRSIDNALYNSARKVGLEYKSPISTQQTQYGSIDTKSWTFKQFKKMNAELKEINSKPHESAIESQIARDKVLKKYYDKGLIKEGGKGVFNEYIDDINHVKGAQDLLATNHLNKVANNVNTLLGGVTYEKTKDKKQSFSDSSFQIREKDKELKKTIEYVIGRKLKDGEKIKVPEFLNNLQTKMNSKLPEGKGVNLINKDGTRGRDLSIDVNNAASLTATNIATMEGRRKAGTNYAVGELFIADHASNEEHAVRKFNFKKSPPKYGHYELNDYQPPIDDSDMEDAYVPTEIDTTPVQQAPTGPSPEEIAFQEKVFDQGVKDREAAEAKQKADDDLNNFNSIDKTMRRLGDAQKPQEFNYDPKNFKKDVPWGEIASSAFGVVKGMADADKDTPDRDEQVSAAMMSYTGELKRLSEIGLRPEDEAYAKRMLTEAYDEGLMNIVSASGGDRNVVLGNLGRLDYQKQMGMMQLAVADSQAKDQALSKYGEAIKYINEFDARRDIANNERDYQEAMMDKQAGATLAAQGWKSFMETMDRHEQNKPGSANHMAKSYFLQKFFGADPSIKGDGPGSVAAYEKKKAEQQAQWDKNLATSQMYEGLTVGNKKKFAELAQEIGWNDATEKLLPYMSSNNATLGDIDRSRMSEALDKDNFSMMFSAMQQDEQSQSGFKISNIQNPVSSSQGGIEKPNFSQNLPDGNFLPKEFGGFKQSDSFGENPFVKNKENTFTTPQPAQEQQSILGNSDIVGKFKKELEEMNVMNMNFKF